jgi:hypothetical protein
VITLPVYKPNGHQGDPVDYFLVFKHRLAKAFQPESLLRKISETALQSADHALVPGFSFLAGSSFISPKAAGALKALESRFKEWDDKHPKGKHDIKIDASRFRKVAGTPWMGCSHFNRAKDGEEPAPENRRVAFVLIDESRFFPVHFPCRDGNEGACQGQCKKAGKRSAAGIKCAFYDGLVREEGQGEGDEFEGDELDDLMKRPYLDPDETAKVRRLIKQRHADNQPDYYARLQAKVEYKSQRDNNQSHSIADRMCNLTSLAMALEYLGIKNPEPSMQFEDYLEKIRLEKGYPERIDSHSWDEVAKTFDAEMTSIELMASIKYADVFHIKEQTMVFDRQKASLPSALLLRIILATSAF